MNSSNNNDNNNQMLEETPVHDCSNNNDNNNQMLEETPVHDEDVKQGRSCCGCLCDMRRAVIILSLLGIAFSILGVLGNYFWLFEPARDDDASPLTDSEEDRLDSLFITHVVLTVLAIVSYSLAVAGAIKYDKCLICINAKYTLINFIVTTVMFSKAAGDIESFDFGGVNVVGPAIGTFMTIYTNMSLASEIKRGIMSPKTYPREEQSCCCV